MIRRAFVFDANRCTGCQACALACEIANDRPTGSSWRGVRTFNPLHVAEVEQVHLSLACNHCADAPCQQQCPARAYRRDEATGAVNIDPDRCVGCRYCAWVCPYDAPIFDEARGVMTKCTFCVEKQHEGGEPACTTACPTGALGCEELPEEELVQESPGFAQAGTRPAVRLLPLESGRRTPKATHPGAEPPWRRLRDTLVAGITLRHEWTLLVFTLTVAVTVGCGLAGVRGHPVVPPLGLVIAGLAAMLLSAAHLGSPRRAWRTGLHAEGSWLSREIIVYGLFIAGLSALGALSEPPAALPWIVAILGIATVLVVDAVYRPVEIRGSGRHHSGEVTLIALQIMMVLAGDLPFAVAVIVLRGLFYGHRQRERAALGLPQRRGVIFVRVLPALAAAAVLILAGDAGRLAAFLLGLIGDIVDRAEFYAELEIPTPDSLMLDELERRLVISERA